MKIGILSDTHNNVEITRKALEIMELQGVGFIIHAGDITSPVMMKEFTGFKCVFVFGNGDLDREALTKEVDELSLGTISDTICFEEDNKKFIVFHGNDVPKFREAVASGEYNYIIKGHTHFYENYISNNARIINPGALYGHNDHSIAILDTEEDRVEMIRVTVEEL